MVGPSGVVVPTLVFATGFRLNVAGRIRGSAGDHVAAGWKVRGQHELAPRILAQVRSRRTGFLPGFPAVNRHLAPLTACRPPNATPWVCIQPSRSGPPWANEHRCVVHFQARSASSMAAAGTERSTMMLFWVDAFRQLLAASTCHKAHVGADAAQRLDHRAHRHAAPDHAASRVHCPGCTAGLDGKETRPLPEHCSTIATVSSPWT